MMLDNTNTPTASVRRCPQHAGEDRAAECEGACQTRAVVQGDALDVIGPAMSNTAIGASTAILALRFALRLLESPAAPEDMSYILSQRASRLGSLRSRQAEKHPRVSGWRSADLGSDGGRWAKSDC